MVVSNIWILFFFFLHENQFRKFKVWGVSNIGSVLIKICIFKFRLYLASHGAVGQTGTLVATGADLRHSDFLVFENLVIF